MSLATQLTNLATRVATECKALRTLINGNAADLSALTTTAKNNLVAAINEVKAQVAASGSGDMTKATYDPNNDGKVAAADSADSAPWAGITGKPSTFPPAAHDAALITSGTIDLARLPVIPSQKQVVSAGDLTALTAPQQADIGQGTVVTTTDGNRYVYTGSGSKTAAGSYVVLADVTPDWSVVTGRPTTVAGFGITDAYTKTEIGDPATDFVATFTTGLT